MTIENFINAPYPMIILEDSSKVCIFVPKLFIHVESDTLLNAYELCKKEKFNFYKRLETVDALHLIPSATDATPLKKRFDIQKILIERFFSFLIALFFTLLFVGIFLVAANKITKKVDQAFVPVSDEKKEARLQRFREKLNVVAPYMKEVKKVFNE